MDDDELAQHVRTSRQAINEACRRLQAHRPGCQRRLCPIGQAYAVLLGWNLSWLLGTLLHGRAS